MRNELLVEEALAEIAKTSTVVSSFRHIAPHSGEDRLGKDFVIETAAGEVSLQVKSSERGRRKFTRHAKLERQSIPVIVVKDDDTIKSLMSRLLEIIAEACRSIGRQIQKIKGKETMRRKWRSSGRICNPVYGMAH